MAMHDLTVTYDEGEPVHVGAGQREMAEFEAQSFGCSSLTALDVKPVTYLRFLAYAALRRSGGLPRKGLPFDAWSEGVESVVFATVEAPDPTPPGPSVED